MLFSYIEQGNHQEAMNLGQELGNNEIQIASLNLQKDEIEDDDDLDDDEKDDQIDALQ
ncbi:type VII secretion protein EssB/YukC [Virgibacillus natechei]